MKQFIGVSKSGNLSEALKGLTNPDFLIICASERKLFEESVQELTRRFPGVPSIGCMGQSYGNTQVVDTGILVTAFTGDLDVVTNVLEEVSDKPVKYIRRLEDDVRKIGGTRENTVCMDFCSGNDECVLSTMYSVLGKKNLQLTGGTALDGVVQCNGKIYEDGCAYALVHNKAGKVKVYKENMYNVTDRQFLVTKANPKEYRISELDGKPFETVYTDLLHISRDQIEKQTFINPLGRLIANEVYIVSLKKAEPDKSVLCYRQVNQKDILSILEMGDFEAIARETVQQIKQEFPRISGVFSINCVFRYLLFEEKHFTGQYLSEMAKLGPHAGLIGQGEHCNKFHTNQTMSCVVFE